MLRKNASRKFLPTDLAKHLVKTSFEESCVASCAYIFRRILHQGVLVCLKRKLMLLVNLLFQD